MLYTLFIFQRKPGDEGDGEYIHGHQGLEIAWTILPLILVFIFAFWGSKMLSDLLRPQDNEMVVEVTGRRWSWSFTYPELEGFTTTELVLPIDQPIVLKMTSEDVIHSFWVPEFRVKQDLLPNRFTTLRIEPSLLGDYKVRCAEICGGNHYNMLADVRVVNSAEFDEWVTNNQEKVDYASMSAAERGALWYEQYGCNACHTTDGANSVGPSWLGLFDREHQFEDGTSLTADADYVRESIEDPAAKIVSGFGNIMPPGFADKFAETEAQNGNQFDTVEDIIAFIESLGQ
ncbi:MAG TPA: cytochrome c oxidase subunit II, partial [Anaerolineae bacterium]|nr:cytochrome c oxidase subunit II [Anaerolineae bacterium]